MFALGTFVSNTADRTDHANSIDHGIGIKLIGCLQDGSPIVRKVMGCVISKKQYCSY